jgi:hypothetical protein
MRHLKLTYLSGLSARKRPLLVTEELALKEAFRKRRTVHRHKRLLITGTTGVNESSYELLAGSGLPLNENGCLTPSDSLGYLKDPLH